VFAKTKKGVSRALERADTRAFVRKSRAQALEPSAHGAERLLIISGDAPFFVTHFLTLAEAAGREGYDVHVATPFDPASTRRDADAVRAIEKMGLTFHPIPLKRSSTNPLRELSLIGELAALMARIAPDLVHCIGMKPVLYAGSIARLRKTPAVHSVIGLGLPFMGNGPMAALRRSLILKAFAFVFGNKHSRATVEHEEDYSIFLRAKAIEPARLLQLNGVGVDLARFCPRPSDQAGNDDAPLVMFASRLIAPKGVRDFVEAARRIKARGVPARFVLQCELDAENPTAIAEEEVRGWDDEKVIEWWGHTTEMPKSFRSADIFCLPTYYREGVPKVLLEAAASGLPIVTSDLPGCRDVVRQGGNGFLIAPRDVGALEAALLRLITDAEFRREAGRQSRAMAVEKFSVESYIRTSLAIYRSALESGSGESPSPVEIPSPIGQGYGNVTREAAATPFSPDR
jgi:glycosyltransferase involved in cell wall biosynthesis